MVMFSLSKVRLISRYQCLFFKPYSRVYPDLNNDVVTEITHCVDSDGSFRGRHTKWLSGDHISND